MYLKNREIYFFNLVVIRVIFFLILLWIFYIIILRKVVDMYEKNYFNNNYDFGNILFRWF